MRSCSGRTSFAEDRQTSPATSRMSPGSSAEGEEPLVLIGRPRLSGAARGRRPPKHRAETVWTHVADMGKCARDAGGSATTCRGYTEAPEAPTSGDRRRRRVAQLAEHRSPKPGVGGSSPSAPAKGASMNRQMKRAQE